MVKLNKMNKTKLCIFNDKYCIHDNSGPILFNNKPIERCKEYHYLGITFPTSKNRFKTHFTQKRDKALNAIFAARKTARDSEAVDSQQSLHLQLKIFDTQIQPIYNYGSEIWYTGKKSWRIWDFASLLYQAISWSQNIDFNISRVWRNWAISPYTPA